MSDRPTPHEAIEAVVEFLGSDELTSGLEAELAFHVRVSANLLRIVGRELRHGRDFEEAQRERLVRLLDRDDETVALNRELVARIRDGRLGARDPELLSHLKQTLRERLEISNPRYLGQERN